MNSVLAAAAVWAALAFGMTQSRAEPVTADQFRLELVDVPLCGTPTSGPLSGKALCTVHFKDGTAVVAGSGVMVRGVWDLDGTRVCRRTMNDPLDRRRCVEYDRIGEGRYRNSDGVEVCLGPCAH